MSRLGRFSRQVVDLKTIHHRHARTPSFVSRFSSAAASEPKQPVYSPPPVGITLAKNLGRATFASQNLAAGEVLHAAKPMVVHPCLSLINCLCYNCLRRLPKRDNSVDSPQMVSFCSEDCQQQAKKFYDVEKQLDWSSFHEYCRQQGLKYPLIAKRFACQIISRKIPPDFFELIHRTKLTPEEISLLKEEFTLLNSILKDADIKVENDKPEDPENAKKVSEPLSFLTEEWYVDTLARIRGNALRIELSVQSDEDVQSSAAASMKGKAAVGNGIYMLPSFYNHSCDPNVSVEWTDNAEGKMVALRDIQEGDEVRISYLDTSMDYDARKKYLYDRYKFECDCPRCASKA